MIMAGPFPCTGCIFTKEIEKDRKRFWFETGTGMGYVCGCKYEHICPHAKKHDLSGGNFSDGYFAEFIRFAAAVLGIQDCDLDIFKEVLVTFTADMYTGHLMKELDSEPKEDSANG